MYNKIIFCSLAMVVSILPLISSSPAIAFRDHPRFQEAQKMFRENFKNRSIPFLKGKLNIQYFLFFLLLSISCCVIAMSNECLFYYLVPLFDSLCANKVPGDYQNPYWCHTYIMCDDAGQVFLQLCPGNLIFDPFLDDGIEPVTPVERELPIMAFRLEHC